METKEENNIIQVDPLKKEETSRTIISLRFLLMVFIVFIHSNGVTNFWDENGVEQFYNIPIIENIIITFFTQILSRCAVPLFFLISGYLFYLKDDSYSVLLKKKTKSLLIPFLLWPSLYLILYALRAVIFHTNNPYSGLNLMDWMGVFIGKYKWRALPENPSLVFQFWYVRDLLLLFLISPILKIILDKKPYLLLLFAVFLWMQRSNFYQKNASQGICFFIMGMYFSKRNYTIADLKFANFKELILILLVLCPLDLYLMINGDKYSICHEFNVLIISIFILKLGYWIQNKQKLFSFQKTLADYSFWMFALHQPIVQPVIIKLYKRYIPTIHMYGGGMS